MPKWSALRAAAQAKDAIDSASAAAQASARKVQSIPAADLPLPAGPTGILTYDLEEAPYAAEARDFIRTA